MSRTKYNFNYELVHEIKFNTAIRGHHVYKEKWTPFVGEKLSCRKDNRKEATDLDIHAVGVYKDVSHQSEENSLACHVPIELSRLISGFLGATEENAVFVTVSGKRKRELGLVAPGLYKAHSKRRKYASLLLKEMQDVKKRYSHFNFDLEEDVICRPIIKPLVDQ